MRIICGTDFSQPAQGAADTAAALAVRLSDTLLLVHAQETAGLRAITPQVLAEWSAGLTTQLLEEAHLLRQLGAAVKEQLLTGLPDEKLVEISRRPGTRLVVVSSLGRRAPARWLLGSVSERTAERAAVPTLVVRDAAPLVAWARGERTLKVFVAADFSVATEAALHWVKELKQLGPCEVVVGHVDWPPEQQARLGLGGPLPLTENPPEAQHILERDLIARTSEILGDGAARVRVVPGWGRADAALVALACEEQADLLVAGTHQHHGLQRLATPSVSRGLLHHAPMSVVLVPTPKEVAHGLVAVPQLQRVLAATDFSALGDCAIPYAYSALPPGGVVKLLHVLPPSASPRKSSQRAATQLQLHLTEVRRKLQALIPAGTVARGIRTEVEVVESEDIAAAISQAAERFDAHVICLGSHGRSGVAKAVLGSVAQAVMVQCHRPLLLVRPPAP